MLKRIFIFSMLFICISCFAQETIITDTVSIDRFGVRGHIKSIKEMTYLAYDFMGSVQNGPLAKDSSFHEHSLSTVSYPTNCCYSFNIDGKETAFEKYESPSNFIEKRKFTYNSQGQLTSWNVDFPDERNHKYAKSVVTYNHQGRIQMVINYNIFGNISSKTICSYDKYGNLITLKRLDSQGAIRYLKTFDYKYLMGKSLVTIVFEKDDYSTTKEERQYDDKDRILSKELIFDDSDKVHTAYSYSDDGKLIEERSLESCFRDSLVKYIYDNQHRTTIKRSFFKDNGECVESFNYSTNEYEVVNKEGGDIIETEKYKNGLIQKLVDGKDYFSYKYVYDDKGNWVKATEYKNNVPTYVKERTIVYYP